MSRRSVAPGAWLFRQGNPSDALYVIIQGELDVFNESPQRSPQWLGRLGPGTCLGELALAIPLMGGVELRRSAGACAFGECRVIEITFSSLGSLVDDEAFCRLFVPVAERHLARLRERFSCLFGSLSLEQLIDLEREMTRRLLLAGETLFFEGEPVDCIWVVEEGRLEVIVGRDGGSSRVAELGQGQVVGEIAALTAQPRTATVVAIRDTWLFGISVATFEAILGRDPQAALAMAKTLAERLVRTNKRATVVAAPRVFALVPAHGGIDLRAFAGSLGEALSVPVRVIERSEFTGESFGGIDMESERRRLSDRLGRAEQRQQLCLLLTAEEPDSWSQACLGCSDEVLVIADAEHTPELGPIERYLEETGGRTPDRLVLLHAPGTTRARGTGEWLDARVELCHHHIAMGSCLDFSRLGRFMRRCSLGLALSGGAGRCYVHLGLLGVLQELDVSIDAVSGTSSGAAVAASVAAGYDLEGIRERLDRSFIRRNPFGRMTVPITALLNTAGPTKVVEEICEGVCIEDLWIPFRCVSTNLTTSSEYIHSRGLLSRALMATTALPLIMPPCFFDGEILCDGGLLNNLPVAPLRAAGAAFVLGSNISQTPSLRVDPSLEVCPGGLRLLLQKLAPGAPERPIPGIVEIGYQSLMTAAAMQARVPGGEPDLLLDMPASEFAADALELRVEMEAVGRAHALAHREAIEVVSRALEGAPGESRECVSEEVSALSALSGVRQRLQRTSPKNPQQAT